MVNSELREKNNNKRVYNNHFVFPLCSNRDVTIKNAGTRKEGVACAHGHFMSALASTVQVVCV